MESLKPEGDLRLSPDPSTLLELVTSTGSFLHHLSLTFCIKRFPPRKPLRSTLEAPVFGRRYRITREITLVKFDRVFRFHLLILHNYTRNTVYSDSIIFFCFLFPGFNLIQQNWSYFYYVHVIEPTSKVC